MPRNNYFPSVENKYFERSTAVWQARNVSTAMRVFLRTRLQNQRLKNGLKVFAQKKRLSIRRPFFIISALLRHRDQRAGRSSK